MVSQGKKGEIKEYKLNSFMFENGQGCLNCIGWKKKDRDLKDDDDPWHSIELIELEEKCSEAAKTGFLYLKKHKNLIDTSIDMTKNYVVCYNDCQDEGMTDKLILPTLIAISSIVLNCSPISQMVVLGDIDINGELIKVDNLANTLQFCFDRGVKRVLLPIKSAVDICAVPSELIINLNLIFYQSAEDAVFKALGWN